MSPLDDAGGTGRSAIGEMVFACDVNLGFPCDHPEWAAFFSDHGWRTVDYDDMGRLTETLKSHAATAAFLPAANYFYLRDDPYYAGFASALAMKTSGTTVSSVLIVPKASEARSIVDLKGKRLGYINLYCTTSYFSPAILLAEHNIPFEGFFSTVRPLAAWQHQIDAVVAGDVDATMVEEGIWQDNPANRRRPESSAESNDCRGPSSCWREQPTRTLRPRSWRNCSQRGRRGRTSLSRDMLRIAGTWFRRFSSGASVRFRS